MSSTDLIVLLLVLGAATPLALFPIMCLTARLSGWRDLAAAYPARAHEPGPGRPARWRLTSLGFGWGRYNNCVLWRADDDHLHLRLIPPFNLMCHPPMSVPWAAMAFRKVGRFSAAVEIDGRRFTLPRKPIEQELKVREAMVAERA